MPYWFHALQSTFFVYHTALKQLGDDAKEYISENYGDLQEWLKTEIEASINKLKN